MQSAHHARNWRRAGEWEATRWGAGRRLVGSWQHDHHDVGGCEPLDAAGHPAQHVGVVLMRREQVAADLAGGWQPLLATA
jgi:hypothetical protein